MSARDLQWPRSSLERDCPRIMRCMCPSTKPGRMVLPARSTTVVDGEDRAVAISGEEGVPTAVMLEPWVRRAEAKVGWAVGEGLVPGATPERKMRPFMKAVAMVVGVWMGDVCLLGMRQVKRVCRCNVR